MSKQPNFQTSICSILIFIGICIIPSTVFAVTTQTTAKKCLNVQQQIPANIDLQKIRQTWLGWNNQTRKDLNLDPYILNDQLTRTATVWAEDGKSKGRITHARPGQKAYYDYNIMADWFKNLGLTFKNVNRITFTENIAWNYYSCKSTSKDCTPQVIKALKYDYDFFIKEKTKKSHPHYDSIVNKYFKIIGIGIAIDPKTKKYFLAVHYGTEITSNPEPICKS